MTKVTLNDITAGFGSASLLNDLFDTIETAFDNTVSRDGTAPNTMSADFDMNGNDVLNVGDISATTLTLNGELVVPSDLTNVAVGSIIEDYLATFSVTTTKIADNSVTGAKIALGGDAQGDIMYYDGTDWTALSAGTSGQFLKTQGAGADPVWDTVSTGTEPSDGDKGDIVVSGSGLVWTIDADVVDNTKLANVGTGTIKGRVTAGSGDPEDLTGTQATTLLDVFTSGLKGLAPASGGGTTNFLRADGTWAAPSSGAITRGTAVSASGTSVDFTGLPSGLDRITVMLAGVSLNGSDQMEIRLGDSGGIETSGYNSGSFDGTSDTHVTTGFRITISSTAADDWHGSIVFTRLDGNQWVAQGNFNDTNNQNITCSGSKTLSAELDRLRITTIGGTNTFDAGKINIMYE